MDDRPAIVIGHHPIIREPGLFGQNISLLDGEPLWNVLTRFPHVKAYVFGHTHRWDVQKREGIYLVNLPSTAYTFDAGQPNGGWKYGLTNRVPGFNSTTSRNRRRLPPIVRPSLGLGLNPLPSSDKVIVDIDWKNSEWLGSLTDRPLKLKLTG